MTASNALQTTIPQLTRSSLHRFLQRHGIGRLPDVQGDEPKKAFKVRHYEAIGLVPAADRRESNYRDYSGDDLHRLGFIRRARDLGFSMDEIRDLLKLWSDTERSSADVKALAERHVAELNGKILVLQEMSKTLRTLVDACEGDHRPHCPILDDLEGGPLGRAHRLS